VAGALGSPKGVIFRSPHQKGDEKWCDPAQIPPATPICGLEREGMCGGMASVAYALLDPLRRRFALAAASVAILACATAASASAGLGDLLSPVLTPCSGQTLTKPFLPWSDAANYGFVTNGGFESGATGWALTGSAGVVAGNESYTVHSSTDGRSLALPPGSSATSPATCTGTLSPTMRFFARNTGAASSTLGVSVLYTDALGLRWNVPIATLSGSASWAPSPVALILANVTALPLLSGGSAQVSFRFTPQGAGGAWQIDDTYLDPYKGS
jgi:hypothetical protein